MPFGDRKYDLGVNLAWINCANGHDLGYMPHRMHWGVSWSEDLVRAYLKDIAAKGFSVVRFWAFEKLEGLIFFGDTFKPSEIYEDIIRNGNKEEVVREDKFEDFNVPRVIALDETFLANVHRFMEIAIEHDLEIYWTILSGGNYHRLSHEPHAWALYRLLEKEVLRKKFYEFAMRPFLQAIYPYHNHIYGIDLMNEPEGLYSRWRNVLIDEAEAYTKEAGAIIKNEFSKLKVSVGFRSYSTIENNEGILNPLLDFYDYHHYGENANHLRQLKDWNKPTILGEAGYMGEDSLFSFNFTPDDNEQDQVIRNMINASLNLDYRACLIWRYSPHPKPNDANNLLRENGHLACGEQSTENTRDEFKRSFLRDPDSHWRPVKNTIIEKAQEIKTFNRQH